MAGRAAGVSVRRPAAGSGAGSCEETTGMGQGASQEANKVSK